MVFNVYSPLLLFALVILLVLSLVPTSNASTLTCSNNNITISIITTTLSTPLCTSGWIIINSGLVTNNYNVVAGKGIIINRNGSLIEDFVDSYGNFIPETTSNGTIDIGNLVSAPQIINYGNLVLYGNLGSGLSFINYGNVTLGAVVFLNFTSFTNAAGGSIRHVDYLNNGGMLDGYMTCIGGSSSQSYAGSGGGGAGSSGCNSSSECNF